MRKQMGFTLIELLVVIAIIGLLATIVLVSLNSARAKARDSRKIADFRSISTALQAYYIENDQMLPNLVPGTQVCDSGTNPDEYNTIMNLLVSGGFMGSIPGSPGGGTYCYYNYGAGSVGALMVTTLEAAPSTVTGIPPSCRPWESGVNWCDRNSDKEYCICNTY